MSLGTFRNRPIRRRWALTTLLPMAAVTALVIALTASGGAIGTASGFEDDDGNLAVNSTFDWNGFSPVTWTGTAPNQSASKLVSGWAFVGLTDAQATNSDSGYAGGVKQDDNCAKVIGSKAPNKDDLKRVYLASKTVNGHVFLNLAWVRIPQNTTSASAHVGFEFNQGTTACGGNSDSLVQRTAGDMLIVYDFEGGANTPTITVRRWVASGACEISSDSAPCWGPAQNLSTGGFAEAKVNVGTPVSDTVAPTTETLNDSEFGEAGIDLTAAGIFSPNVCTAFGQAEAVSRSSGNSGNAAMEDLVGPAHINLSNCGEVIIKKRTDPRGVNQNFSYGSTLSGGQLSCTQSTPTNFTLNDNGNANSDSTGNTQDCTNVPIGSYTVTEAAQAGFTLESLTCQATGGSSGSQDAVNKFKANITIAAGNEVVTCVYVNQQNTATLATQVSNAGPVFPSNPVRDTATVTGNQPLTPTGTVTFFLCSGVCTSGGTNIGTGTLSGSGNTASALSPNVNTVASPLAPGTYCFRAEWPGDANYPAALSEFGGPNGTNECFVVQQIATGTVTTPSVGSGGTTTFGSSVTDHAVVTAVQSGDGAPTGTVTFFICDPSQTSGGACPDPNGTQVGQPVDTAALNPQTTPPGSSADSTAVTANKTGTWCWRAVYTPGGANGANYTGSSDASAGECFTVTDTTGSTSAQDWLPNDTATVTAAHGAPLTGTLSAQLYTGNNCGATSGSAVNGQLYTKTLSGATSAADRTLTTSNSTFKVTLSSSTSWLVSFTSDDPNVSSSSHCESSTLTIAN